MSCRVKFAWFDEPCRIVERNVFETIRWNDVQVHVRHFEAGDDERRPLTSECPNLGVADAVSELEEVVGPFHRKIRPSVDLDCRNDEDVPVVDRIDRHNRDCHVVAVHEGSG